MRRFERVDDNIIGHIPEMFVRAKFAVAKTSEFSTLFGTLTFFTRLEIIMGSISLFHNEKHLIDVTILKERKKLIWLKHFLTPSAIWRLHLKLPLGHPNTKARPTTFAHLDANGLSIKTLRSM
jgi:hypothetical protein